MLHSRRHALPADPALICAYLTERAAAGRSVGAIDMACGAIAYRHRMHGLDDPVLTEGVRQVRRGLRRMIGAAPRRSALRRSELAALTLADVEHTPGGVLLTIRRSKTDQYADGQFVAVVHGQPAATDPSPPWMPGSPSAEPTPAGVQQPAQQVVTRKPISGEGGSIVLRKRARAAGLAAERITAHSLRAGHATSAALAGVALDRIAAQTRHKRLSTLIERYIRPAQVLEHTSSRDLGLLDRQGVAHRRSGTPRVVRPLRRTSS